METPKLFNYPALCLVLLTCLTYAISGPATADDSFLKTPNSSRLFHTIAYRPMVYKLINENTVLVEVSINGSSPKTFWLDTGANTSVIKSSLASELKKKGGIADLPGKPYGVAGKSAKGVVIDHLNLGGFNINNFAFMEIPDKNFDPSIGNQIDGIIGLDIIKNLECLFDFPRHQITMYAPARMVMPPDGTAAQAVSGGLTPEEVAAVGFGNIQSVPITDSPKDGIKYVHVLWRNAGQSSEEDMTLDIGAATTTISPSLASRLAVQPTSEGSVSYGFDGTRLTKNGMIDQVQIGQLVLHNQSVQYSNQEAKGQSLPPMLGMDILSKYKVLVDFSSSKMYLKLPDAAPAPVKINIGPGTTPLAPTP